jgi:acyl-coenzyme A synthetase/AMP-(fatty) acid ligase
VIEGATSGNLCIGRSWPGQMRGIYGDHERFVQNYFNAIAMPEQYSERRRLLFS